MNTLAPSRKKANSKLDATVIEITRLHGEIISAAKSSLQKAKRIGELLTQQKEKLEHGQWLPWLKANLPISQQTASNYMRIFRDWETVKLLNVGNLSEAYRLLAPPKEPDALSEIETRISERLRPLDDARAALLEIRDKRLWREQFKSFGDFLATIDKNYSEFLIAEEMEGVTKMQLSKVILDPAIHCRANGVEEWVVESFEEAMRGGDKFPPIDVFDTEQGIICADGHHRVHAARQAGFTTIQATVHTGTFQDCVRFAVGANSDGSRGLILTKEERVKIAGMKNEQAK